MTKQMTPSALSNRVTDILRGNDFTREARGPNVEGARSQLVDLFGADKVGKINLVVESAAAVILAGEVYHGMPRDLKAHTSYCNAFNDLCGFPDEALERIKGLQADGFSLAEIAGQWGWDYYRLKAFAGGNRSVYFEV